VNDPGYERTLQRGLNKEKATAERERLFKIIEKLVLWENTNNKEVLEEARAEIRRSWVETCKLNANHPQAAELFNPEKLPAFHDPFSGGGALPLEAQRLGLEAYASDLNPVAVLINKAMIELPPRFANRPPVASELKGAKQTRVMEEEWTGARGLAEDVLRYGAWMREEAHKRIGHLYPNITITKSMAADRPDLQALVGKSYTVIAWLWARTVPSPNPAFADTHVPLATTFNLSNKPGKEAYVEPVIDREGYHFTVKVGRPVDAGKTAKGTKSVGSGSSFLCLLSGSPMTFAYLRAEAKAGQIGSRLMAIIADGPRGRIYLPPTPEMESIALKAAPASAPDTNLPEKALGFRVQEYGMIKWRHLFTNRQLLALGTFSDLIGDAVKRAQVEALRAGWSSDNRGLEEGGAGAKAYGEAIGVYLALVVDRCADFNNTMNGWRAGNEKIMNLFSRQAIPMVWDYGEANILADVVGGFPTNLAYQSACLATLIPSGMGYASQADATQTHLPQGKVISTDPPYYDNIAYADLSDFFYVWLRKSLKGIYPQLFSTVSTPKAEELVATPYRHGNKVAAESFFLEGMTHAIHNLVERSHPAFPVTIYYAFKQSATNEDKTVNSGWETFLQAILTAGFTLTGTWPIRSEQTFRMRGLDSNALASSIVLVCRKRDAVAPTVGRREFLRELNAKLPEALSEMTRSGINSPLAPVDLSQAIIGPGMAIFSQYAAVLEADGSAMNVHTALTLINRFLAEDDLDPESQFCLHWFEQRGWAEGPYGDADTLCRAKGTSVEHLKQAGVVESGGGRVRLFRWSDYPDGWHPERDPRIPVWEALHHLIRALDLHGEEAAGELLAGLQTRAEGMRTLAYRLYTLCERQSWAEDARAYNTIITAWPAIEAMATRAPRAQATQTKIDL